MRALRLSKAALVAAIAFTISLAAYGNVVDPEGNLDFVRHVMAMDTLPPDAAIRSRAITHPKWQEGAFVLIVATEVIVAVLCWIGAGLMLAALGAPSPSHAAGRAFALTGLSLGFVLFQAGLLGIGGEWFAMWMSKTWNAQGEVFRYAVTVLGALIYVALPEGEQ